MAQRKARLFLGNLPQHSTEAIILQRLQNYGTVNSVEIKHKRNFDDNTVASTFAFVNLETDNSTLQQCLRELRNRDWDGSYIKVDLAKESFLDRLQKEREEASKSHALQNAKQQDTVNNSSPGTTSMLSKEEYLPRKRKTLSESGPDELCEEEKLVSKLESFSDLWRDDPPAKLAKPLKKERTVTNSSSYREYTSEMQFPTEGFTRSREGADSVDQSVKHSDSLTVKSQTSGNANSKSELQDTSKDLAAKAGELKRVKALEEKSKAIKQQKDAIKQALSSIDTTRPSNKIIFDDDGDPLSIPPIQQNVDLNKHGKRDYKSKLDQFSKEKGKSGSKVNGQLQLFGGDDDNDNWQGDFRFKKQFEGKKGQKLLEMQARFKDDERFVIDERFYESDDDEDKTNKSSAPATEEEKELQEEKAKEMEILASVLGQPVQPSVTKKSTFNPMVRFDPLKPSHAKFEIPNPKPNDPKLKSIDIDKKKKLEKLDEEKDGSSQRVEKEPLPFDDKQFYQVARNIRDLFKKEEKKVEPTESTTFSLRQMFSSSNEDSEHREETDCLKAKPIQNTQMTPKPANRPALRGFQDSKPLAMFTKKILRPQLNSVTNTFCKDVDVEAIKEKFSENRRALGRMIHKKKVVLERQQHFKHKIGVASLAHKSLDREAIIRRKTAKPWEKKRSTR